MTKVMRILLLIAALLMGLAYFFPLWQFEIYAPQYPEGLFMQIWTHKITGNLQTINILNHYVGMAKIEEGAFAELKVFPIALAIFIGATLLVSVLARTKPLFVLAASVLGGSIFGLYDFWKWEYNFGHNLNPDAAIIMEDMVYQPPMIGSKDFLNITAAAWPGIGGIAFGLAVVIILFCAIYSFRKSTLKSNLNHTTLTLFLSLLTLPGCLNTNTPEAVEFGKDSCNHCKMTMTDSRFGGEIIMKKGKIYKFDALECLSTFYAKNKAEVHSVYVLDATAPGTFVLAEKASFVINESLRSPMGKGVLASLTPDALKIFMTTPGQQVFNWNQILERIETSNQKLMTESK